MKGGLNIHNDESCGGSGIWQNETDLSIHSYRRFCQLSDIDVRIQPLQRIFNTSVNATTVEVAVRVADEVESTAIRDLTKYLTGTTAITRGLSCTHTSCSHTGSFCKDLMLAGMPIDGCAMGAFAADAFPNMCAFDCDFPHRKTVQAFTMSIEKEYYAGPNKTAAEFGFALALGIAALPVVGNALSGRYWPGCSVSSVLAPDVDQPACGIKVTFTAKIAADVPSKPASAVSLCKALYHSFPSIPGSKSLIYAYAAPFELSRCSNSESTSFYGGGCPGASAATTSYAETTTRIIADDGSSCDMFVFGTPCNIGMLCLLIGLLATSCLIVYCCCWKRARSTDKEDDDSAFTSAVVDAISLEMPSMGSSSKMSSNEDVGVIADAPTAVTHGISGVATSETTKVDVGSEDSDDEGRV